ncbi:MAG: hypothetical protein QUT30_12645 [Acidobacteriota bacterium]|nr:hypothetical protein [Acidobacteriota bacterium]
MNRHHQDVIERLRTENQVLQETLGKKRILLNDHQRCRLTVKGKVLGRKALEEISTILTPKLFFVGIENWWPKMGLQPTAPESRASAGC